MSASRSKQHGKRGAPRAHVPEMGLAVTGSAGSAPSGGVGGGETALHLPALGGSFGGMAHSASGNLAQAASAYRSPPSTLAQPHGSAYRRRHAAATGVVPQQQASGRPTPRSARKPGAGAILRGLDPFGSLSRTGAAQAVQVPPARSGAAYAALLQASHGGGPSSVVFNPSPPSHARGAHAQPSPEGRFQRKHRLAGASQAAELNETQSSPRGAAVAPVRGLEPADEPEVDSPSPAHLRPSPSLYTAPPASLFALVATPDASHAGLGPPGHSSNSDHGTASAALSSLENAPTSPTFLGPAFGAAAGTRPAGRHHHHQSLSSTPLPMGQDADDPLQGKIESPSPTLSFFAGSPPATASAVPHSHSHFAQLGKRRTNLSTMISPSEEPEGSAEDDTDMLNATRSPRHADQPPQMAPDSTTPSHDEPVRADTTPMSPLSAEPASAGTAAPPAPVVLNLTLQLTPSATALLFSSTDATAIASSGATLSSETTPLTLESLVAALLPLLPADQQTQLASTLRDHPSMRVGQVVLRDQHSSSDASTTDKVKSHGGPARVVRAKSLFATRGQEAEAAAQKAAEARLTQRNSVHAGTVVHGGSFSSHSPHSAMSPRSPSSALSSPHSSRSGGGRFAIPRGDLAAQLRNKRASFLSRSLHTLAVDDGSVGEDAWAHDPVLASSTSPPPVGTALFDPQSPVTAALTGATDDPPRTDAEEQQLLQAALDQDVVLDEYGLSFDQAGGSPSAHLRVAISPGLDETPEHVPQASPIGGGAGRAPPTPGEDTELWDVHHATLLLERLRLEPLPGAAGADAFADPVSQHLLDVRLIHDRILGHLARLKKLITRRHFKSRETLTRKLTNITDDDQVVDWISKEFLDDTGPGVAAVTNAHIARPGRNRRASMAVIGTYHAPPMHARSASSMVRFSLDTPRAPRAPAPSPRAALITSSVTVTELETAEEAAEDTQLVPESSSTAASSADSWSSPFMYPLSATMLAALEARVDPSLSDLRVLCEQPELRDLLLTASDNWDFDIFTLNRLSDFHPVLALGLHAFQAPELSGLALDLEKVGNFLRVIEAGYPWQNPYHNCIHSADVLQNCMQFLRAPLLQATLRPLDVLAMLTAAIIHDYMHAGLTNAYLCATSHPLALTYNDQAVLEHQSLAEAFRALAKPECNFLASLPREDQRAFRASVVSMVLHTDMTRHVEAVNGLEAAVMRHRNAGTWFGQEDAAATAASPAPAASPAAAADRRMLLDFILHAADISNPAKPLRIGLQWASLIGSEFHLQGDRERAGGLAISPMMDRNRPLVDLQQFAFINVVVLPLFSQFAEVLGGDHLQAPLSHLAANRAFYQNRMNVAKLVREQAVAGGAHAALKPVASRQLSVTSTAQLNQSIEAAAERTAADEADGDEGATDEEA